MIASQSGCAFTAQREACVLSTYPDGAGFSQGFGIFGAKLGDTKSFEECIRLFIERMKVTDDDMAAAFKDVPFTQVQYDAIADTAYNIGRTQLLKETALRDAIDAFAGEPKSKALQDAVAVTLLGVKHSEKGYHNLARKMSAGALFLRGDYGDLRFVKLWTEGKVPGLDKPLMVAMPIFRGAA